MFTSILTGLGLFLMIVVCLPIILLIGVVAVIATVYLAIVIIAFILAVAAVIAGIPYELYAEQFAHAPRTAFSRQAHGSAGHHRWVRHG